MFITSIEIGKGYGSTKHDYAGVAVSTQDLGDMFLLHLNQGNGKYQILPYTSEQECLEDLCRIEYPLHD